MFELQALSFLGAVTELRTLIVRVEFIPEKAAPIGPEDRADLLAPHVTKLIDELRVAGARSALASAVRLKDRLDDAKAPVTYTAVGASLADIESRFADHLIDIKLFVLDQNEASLFQPADDLLNFAGGPVQGFSGAFPNAAFEIEEAAKCIALGRYTASVFHCMRTLEHGIKALAKRLEIPDPTKPSEKNWGIILGLIKDEIDAKWPKNARLAGSTGARLEALYATLDAVKNPLRNATMHVEAVYAPHEALHIARCTGVFMMELMKHCDEGGIAPADSAAKATVGDPPASGEARS